MIEFTNLRRKKTFGSYFIVRKSRCLNLRREDRKAGNSWEFIQFHFYVTSNSKSKETIRLRYPAVKKEKVWEPPTGFAPVYLFVDLGLLVLKGAEVSRQENN